MSPSGADTRSVRPTRDGWVALVAGLALGAVGLLSGNNVLYLVAAPLWAVLLLALPLLALLWLAGAVLG